MVKIQELNLRKILVGVVPYGSDDKRISKPHLPPFGWSSMTYEQLEEINKERMKDKGYNMYYVIPDREYLIIDADNEKTYLKLEQMLREKKLFSEKAITKSYSGKTYNKYYKCHFWFKINKKQYQMIKEETQIKLNEDVRDKGEGNGEVFFGSRCFIGEFIDSEISEIPNLDVGDYFEIYEEILKITKDNKDEKITIEDDYFSDDENEKKEIKKNKTNKKDNLRNNINNDNLRNNTNDENELINILDNLNEKRFILYSYWLVLYFIFINENYDLSIFDDYSRKYGGKKYNKQKNDSILKNIKPQKSYTIATLYFWLKEDNYNIFKKLCKKRNDFWNIKLNNISIADFYYQINPDGYIYEQDNNIWYEYNENNILIIRGSNPPLSLTNGMGRKLQEIANEQYKFINADNENFKTITNKYNKFYEKVGTHNFILSVIQQLKQPYCKDINNLMNNINYIAFNNQLYDIEKNKFRDIEKNDYITKTTKYNYEPKYITEDNKKSVYKFINSLFENDENEKYFLNSTACQLFGNNVQERIYFHTGRGGNGKSITQNLIQDTLGEYFEILQSNFLFGTTSPNSANPELLELKGVRYVSVSEPDDTEKKLNVALLKRLSDPIELKGRELYCNNIKFKGQFTLNICCNDLPELSKGGDGGFRRRLSVQSYPFQFRTKEHMGNNPNNRLLDVEMSKKLKKPEFIMSFMSILLELAHKYKNTKLELPQTVINDSSKYMDENNPLFDWFNENITRTNDKKDFIQASVLNDNFTISEYCKKKLSPKEFHKLMEKFEIYNDTKQQNKRYYYGIKFNVNINEEILNN